MASMLSNIPRPLFIRVVAWYSLGFGVLNTLTAVMALVYSSFNLSLALILLHGLALIAVGFGLFRKTKWSRIGVVIVAVAGMVLAVLSLLNGDVFTSLLTLLINGGLAYLFYSDSEIGNLLNR